MFVEERVSLIIQQLNTEGKVIVKELAKRFEVTEDCIRKDLKNLENDGVIKRTYGGAVLARKSAVNIPVSSRKDKHAEAKHKIAVKAVALIERNQTVFLDISSTNEQIAEQLIDFDKPITVLTNMVSIIQILKVARNVKVIGIGGVYNSNLDGFVGAMAMDSIKRFRPDIAFIGSSGVSLDNLGISTFDVEDGNTKQKVIEVSKQVYLAMDHSKFYQDGVYTFSTLHDIDGVITDRDLEKSVAKALSGVEITVL